MEPEVLLARIERYLSRSGMTPTVFGKEAVGDSALVFRLRHGREPRKDLRQRILQWMADNPPARRSGR